MMMHVVYSWNSQNARHETDVELPDGPRVWSEGEVRELVARKVTGQREDAQYLHLRDIRGSR